MTPQRPRWLIWCIGFVALAFVGCGSDKTEEKAAPSETVKTKPAAAEPLRDEIPPDQLRAVMEAHYRGLGAMERYEYPAAIVAFRDIHKRAPGWIPGSINLAIALLNQGGKTEAEAKAKGAAEGTPAEAKSNLLEAVTLLDEVIRRDPRNPYAYFCKGIIYRNEGSVAEAYEAFSKVVEIDPDDANALLEYGASIFDQDNPTGVSPEIFARKIPVFVRCLERNPYLVQALYKLQEAYRISGNRADAVKVLALFTKLNPQARIEAPGEEAALVYGQMGKYASVVDPFPRDRATGAAPPPPRFEPPRPIEVALGEGTRWAKSADFTGPLEIHGRARARFGQAVASFDADGDGKLDLYLVGAVVGPKGVRDALLLNKGEGKFVDATLAFGLPEDRAGLGVAAADFDADRRVDLFLTGVGDNRLYRNLGGKFSDVTQAAGITASSAVSPTARWLDIDQDGDLDLYILNYAATSDAGRCFRTGEAPAGLANLAYRNDGRPSPIAHRPEDNWVPLAAAPPDIESRDGLSLQFTRGFPADAILGDGVKNHAAIAALDLDDDRDIDLVVASDGQPPVALLNDRVGAFYAAPLPIPLEGPVNGLLSTALDKDSRPDLVALGASSTAWLNRSTRPGGKLNLGFDAFPIDARGWRSAKAVDLDLDSTADLVALPAAADAIAPAWARDTGKRLEARPLALGPDGTEPALLVGLECVDLVGDALPDLFLIRDGQAPSLARNLGNGQHWLAIDLAGRWKVRPEQMRTNSQGLGARLALEGEGILAPFDYTTPSSGLAQSVGPFVLGLGANTSAPLLRIRWPDGVMQCELNVTADKSLNLVENNRKTGSCPVLFTWNGTRFECLGDFLGGGGMGYLVAPGVYGQPDRDESVAIAPGQLAAVDGVYRLAIVEPMDEVAYLDHLILEVVDRPPGVSSTPDERFAPEGPRPTGEILAWTKTIEPVKALDHAARDVTPLIRAWDRQTVDQFARLPAWVGYTEPHALILDFGNRLGRFEPNDRLILALAGWVEYPYSQTNYAASTAGVTLRPPTLERQKDDGTWEMLDPHPGYPAGLPRMMTVDLTGKVAGARCVLRLTTNMECYWDQAFVAVVEDQAGIRTHRLPVARASLGDRGYLRETSPDGRLPLLYEYEHPDPAPLARMEGTLTRMGDVRELLMTDDDRVCTVGSGEEVRLEFDGKSLPQLPQGWTRSYVLRAIGYCKDADPFTAGSDSVQPLPWRAMPPYPFEPGVARPRDAAYEAYLREYQTRPAGVR